MKGRKEQEIVAEAKVREMLVGKPRILKDYSMNFGDKTFNTKREYIIDVIKFLDYLHKEYGFNVNDLNVYKQINMSHINNYMESIKYKNAMTLEENSATYRSCQLYAIKNFLNYLYKCKYIEYNPATEVAAPKDTKEHEIIELDKEELAIVKNNVFTGVGSKRARTFQKKWVNRDWCIISLAITTGLRVSALRNINIEDIDFENQKITIIEKGAYERKVMLTDSMVEIMKRWLQDRNEFLDGQESDALFISNKHVRLTTKAIGDLIKKYTYNIDKHITPHKLRATMATNLYESTNDIYVVADALGHHNLANTKRYAKISDQKKRAAINTLDNLI